MTQKQHYTRRPRDLNQLAKRIVDIATGNADDTDSPVPAHSPLIRSKNPHAVELGRLGGKKGGRARADALSPRKTQRNSQIRRPHKMA